LEAPVETFGQGARGFISADTFRVRDFLSRNRVLFTWIDIESDPQVDQLLKQFGMTESDTPVLRKGESVPGANFSGARIHGVPKPPPAR
jgi:hypothetical protein